MLMMSVRSFKGEGKYKAAKVVTAVDSQPTAVF